MTRRSSFETLAVPHMPAAYTLAYWLVRSRPDAEDIVQDAYLRAFRGYDTLKGTDIRPWLLTIVRNVAYRWLAKRGRNRNVISFDEAFPGRTGDVAGDANIASEALSAEAMLIGEGERVQVRAALADLAPVFREVIVLRELEEMSYREIATITGVPVGTVMSRLSRARADLKKLLTARIEKDEPHAL